jgi:hypothetical protein
VLRELGSRLRREGAFQTADNSIVLARSSLDAIDAGVSLCTKAFVKRFANLSFGRGARAVAAFHSREFLADRRERVAGTIVRFYTLRAQSLVRNRYREPSSRYPFAPICRKYKGLALWVVCKRPEGC